MSFKSRTKTDNSVTGSNDSSSHMISTPVPVHPKILHIDQQPRY